MRAHNTYDEQANQYIQMVAERNQRGAENAPLESVFFNTIGNVKGLTVLDAGCGEGFVSRLLASQGAHVTGIDISAPLVEVYYFHRTMEEYIDEFSENGFLLRQLKDLKYHDPDHKWNKIPYLMVLEFVKN